MPAPGAEESRPKPRPVIPFSTVLLKPPRMYVTVTGHLLTNSFPARSQTIKRTKAPLMFPNIENPSLLIANDPTLPLKFSSFEEELNESDGCAQSQIHTPSASDSETIWIGNVFP